MRAVLTAGLLGLAISAAAADPVAEVPRAARDRGIAATVQVNNAADDQSGSGVVVRKEGKAAYALTAAHLVPKARAVDVVVAGAAGKPGKSLKAEVLARSDKVDLAVLRFAAADAPPPIPVAPAGVAPKAVASVGWEKGDAPTALDEALKGKVKLRRPGTTDAMLCWEASRKQAKGRSGGPLLDESGRVVGLASGHDGGAGYYVHADEVRAFLTAAGLKFVLEEDR